MTVGPKTFRKDDSRLHFDLGLLLGPDSDWIPVCLVKFKTHWPTMWEHRLAHGKEDTIVKQEPISNEIPERNSSAVQATETSSLARPDEREIADLAYQRWVERGCPQGSPEEDWFEAERELLSRNRS